MRGTVKVLSLNQKPIKIFYMKGCKMQHDIQKWLSTKPPDVGKDCYVFQQFGYCPRGLTCR